jgi:3-hydroxybutyryl-CoA dehydrogenase
MAGTAVHNVAIIGAGLMGFGVGVEFARFGYQVTLFNRTSESSQNAMRQAREALDLMAETELISSAEANDAYRRLRPATDLAAAAEGSHYVLESVAELPHVKMDIFAALDRLCPPETILATNTSGLSLTDIATATRHPERTVVTHYFQPPHLIPLVEVVGGQRTSPETIRRTAEILRGLRKRVAVIDVEIPGFVGNRIQGAIRSEVHSLVDKGVCTPQMIDDIIQFGFGRRMAYTGYFKRMDLIGLDFSYTAAKGQGRSVWPPLAEHVERGELGMKSGKGFYEWRGDSAAALHRRMNMELIRLLKQDMKDGTI